MGGEVHRNLWGWGQWGGAMGTMGTHRRWGHWDGDGDSGAGVGHWGRWGRDGGIGVGLQGHQGGGGELWGHRAGVGLWGHRGGDGDVGNPQMLGALGQVWSARDSGAGLGTSGQDYGDIGIPQMLRTTGQGHWGGYRGVVWGSGDIGVGLRGHREPTDVGGVGAAVGLWGHWDRDGDAGTRVGRRGHREPIDGWGWDVGWGWDAGGSGCGVPPYPRPSPGSALCPRPAAPSPMSPSAGGRVLLKNPICGRGRGDPTPPLGVHGGVSPRVPGGVPTPHTPPPHSPSPSGGRGGRAEGAPPAPPAPPTTPGRRWGGSAAPR